MLTFIHWRYPAAQLALLLPPRLQVDTFDGSGWVGITPFYLRGLRPPLGPPLPWISSFPETNCRTYVRGPDGRSGIWFFSLDAARLPAVVGARLAYGLPYAWSKMKIVVNGNRIAYQSTRRWPDDSATVRIEVEHAGRIETRELESFLVERYLMYSVIRKRLHCTQVEHPPWPLERAGVLRLEQTLTRAAGLQEPAHQSLIHFSSGVTARIGAPMAA